MDTILSGVARARAAAGWSQASLAARAGVSRAEISAIETGRLQPSVTVGLRIASALGLTVEALFAGARPSLSWAWNAPTADRRVWQAQVRDRTLTYPVELTAAGVLPHDAVADEGGLHPRPDAGAPAQTLVIAGCDPLVPLLAQEMARHGIRVLPLLRSGRASLELLRDSLVHVAGVHFSTADGRSANLEAVRAMAGLRVRLVHQVRWQAGIVVGAHRRERTPGALVRAGVRWVNREEGSAARQVFDSLLSSRRRPPGYSHVARDHRSVAATVASGWADAGICVGPVAAEAGLPFLPIHSEDYELCVPDALVDDPRIRALLAALGSRSYRERLADVPGCSAARTGDVRSAA